MQRRIALVTSGFDIGGGVPTVARWLRAGLTSKYGYAVDVHDLATYSRDTSSRRISRPQTLLRRSLQGQLDESQNAQAWGANLVELEPMRYRPRAELSRALSGYDLIQVVAGAPALAASVLGVGPPVVLQVATTLRWEREARREESSTGARFWGDLMTTWASATERRALRGVDAVLVENDSMFSFVRSMNAKSVIKAPPGVDTSRFSPSGAGWNRDGYLLCVGRLSEPRKRLDRLIRAYELLSQSGGAAVPSLVLAGRGPISPEIRRLVMHSDVADQISVREDIHPSNLPDLYRGASVFVQASHEEGLGISVLEAMASGLPVVAIANAGTRESVVSGTTGHLVEQDVEDAIPSELARGIRDALSPAGLIMATEGRLRCLEIFSTDSTLAKFAAAYAPLLRADRAN